MSSLVSGLLLRGGTSALTTEGVQAWKTNYQQLVQSGAAAMPALRAFLAENQDTVFDTETARALGQRSARLAAFDALQQIGGPEAIALLEQTLGETKAPREIAALAWNLEDMAAGQYREKILAAARSVLGKRRPSSRRARMWHRCLKCFRNTATPPSCPNWSRRPGVGSITPRPPSQTYRTARACQYCCGWRIRQPIPEIVWPRSKR
jgi:hypothetical protein